VLGAVVGSSLGKGAGSVGTIVSPDRGGTSAVGAATVVVDAVVGAAVVAIAAPSFVVGGSTVSVETTVAPVGALTSTRAWFVLPPAESASPSALRVAHARIALTGRRRRAR
jgi:hypothetical protein